MLVFAVFSGFILAILAPFLERRLKDRVGWVMAVLPLILTIYFARLLPQIEATGPIQQSFDWVPSLGIQLSFYVDGLSVLFALLISGIGTLVMIYAGGYLHGHHHLGRFYLYILSFMAAMIGVVTADNVIGLFVFWELTSISSYLLIGFKHEYEESRQSALHALLITGGGGLALMAGLILLGLTTGTFEFSEMLTKSGMIHESNLYLPILLLILAGAFTKSAQMPFHFWLPGAMAAPTPVSAYLHSATMVKAGVFLLARLNPVLGGTAEWHYLVTLAGAVTMLLGAALALPQRDLKKLLAYSTVSALGTLVLLLGLSTVMATQAALVFLVVHSLYKGALFMVAGVVDHETGTRDVHALDGLLKIMPITAVAAALAAFSMSGFPPLLGFIGKELIYEAKLQVPTLALAVISAGVLANIINVAVAFIVGIGPFLGKQVKAPKFKGEAPWSMWLGPLTLSIMSLFAGFFAESLGKYLISPAVSAVQAEAIAVKLKMWHGINPVLLLSIFTVIGGLGLYFCRCRWEKQTAGLIDRAWNFRTLFDRGLTGTMRLAGQLTRIWQNGSLASYMAMMLLTMVSLVGFTLWTLEAPLITWLKWSTPPVFDTLLLLVLIVAAFAARRIQSRLATVVLLGLIGYGVALIFVIYGAPDLAITQILIETLTVILFVFIIRRLPKKTAPLSRQQRWLNIGIATASGLVMTILVMKAINVQLHAPISTFFAENSLTLAHGRNVVNVILVDFRALDTLGEITVLTIAAIGVIALLKSIKRSNKDRDLDIELIQD